MDMRKDVQTIIAELKQGNPLCLIRMGDGELKAIRQSKNVISRGKQKVYTSLSEELKSALQTQMPGYWIGLPCPKHNSEFYKQILRYVSNTETRFTFSDIWANDNWGYVQQHLPEAVKDKRVIIVCGEDQDWSQISEISPERIIRLPSEDAWSSRHIVSDIPEELPHNTVALLSCGPTGRVLASRWYHKRPDSSFLDIGSCFDPRTRGITHNYQKINSNGRNNVPYCNLCNRKGK